MQAGQSRYILISSQPLSFQDYCPSHFFFSPSLLHLFSVYLFIAVALLTPKNVKNDTVNLGITLQVFNLPALFTHFYMSTCDSQAHFGIEFFIVINFLSCFSFAVTHIHSMGFCKKRTKKNFYL